MPRRFHGPPGSGNGGWCAGALSTFLPGAPAVTVRLSAPPPLERPMSVVVDAADGRLRAVARDGEAVVLTATALDTEAASGMTPVEPVGPAAARAASSTYRGLAEHPFPTCFTCGPGRADGDGLRLAPGLLLGSEDRTACVWTPHPDVDVAQAWASVDCPGGWSTDLVGRPMVLGSITVALRRVPKPGEVCVVTGAARSTQGRKTATAATLWSFGDTGFRAAGSGRGDALAEPEPELLATAEHVWIAVDPATFGTPS